MRCRTPATQAGIPFHNPTVSSALELLRPAVPLHLGAVRCPHGAKQSMAGTTALNLPRGSYDPAEMGRQGMKANARSRLNEAIAR